MPDTTFDPIHVLAELHARRIRYVVVGDLAAMAHGSSVTPDRLELCIADDDDDLDRLASILQVLDAHQDEGAGDPSRVVFHTSAGRLECLDLSYVGNFEDLDARATDIDLGHGVIARVGAPEDLGAQRLSEGDVVAAVRNAALGSEVPDGGEFEGEELSWRRQPWRRLWRAFEDADRYLNEVNAGERPLWRQRER